jgi:hypothetical protein
MHGFPRGENGTVHGGSPDIPRPPPLLPLLLVRFDNGLRIRPTRLHQAVLDKQVVDEKPPFIVLRFLVKPQLVFRYVGEPEMLAEVGELFVDMAVALSSLIYSRPPAKWAATNELKSYGYVCQRTDRADLSAYASGKKASRRATTRSSVLQGVSLCKAVLKRFVPTTVSAGTLRRWSMFSPEARQGGSAISG